MSFASNGNGNGSSGSPVGDIGSIAGFAGQLGSLTGMPGAELVGLNVRIELSPQSANAGLLGLTASSVADTSRYFHGFVASFGRLGNSGTVTRYAMSVVPWFQNKTAQEILTDIFQEFGFKDFEFNVKVKRPKFEYVVMYKESHYNFCAWLMEQQGLLWSVRFEKDRHVLVVSDSNPDVAFFDHADAALTLNIEPGGEQGSKHRNEAVYGLWTVDPALHAALVDRLDAARLVAGTGNLKDIDAVRAYLRKVATSDLMTPEVN